MVEAARRSGRGGGRQRLLAEALRLFAARDFSDVSMQDVADAAGVTKAALYYHFEDKVDLYCQAVFAKLDEIRGAMGDALAAGGSLEDRLVRVARIGVEELAVDVLRSHFNAHEHLDQARHERIHREMDRLGEPLVRCFEEASGSSPAIAPRAAAKLFTAVLGALVMAGLDVPHGSTDEGLPTDRSEAARLAVRLFLRGYLSLARGEDGGKASPTPL